MTDPTIMKQCLGQGSPVLNPGQWICLHGSGQTRHLRNFVNHEEFNTNKKRQFRSLKVPKVWPAWGQVSRALG